MTAVLSEASIAYVWKHVSGRSLSLEVIEDYLNSDTARTVEASNKSMGILSSNGSTLPMYVDLNFGFG